MVASGLDAWLETQATGEHLVASTARSIHASVLDEYRRNDGWPIHVRQLSASLGVGVGTVHRYLAALCDGGFVERGPSTKDGYRPKLARDAEA